jgi:membrane-bound metal-dependent hydrolase YbcI (DUF457 family)
VGAVIASGLPDLDFLGVLLGYKLEQIHRKATHSLVVLIVLAALALWASHGQHSPLETGTVWAWALALLAHPLVDILTTSPREDQVDWGIPLLWPLTSRRFHMSRALVRPPRLDSYASKALLRDLLPELALFGSTCLSLILLGSIL